MFLFPKNASAMNSKTTDRLDLNIRPVSMCLLAFTIGYFSALVSLIHKNACYFRDVRGSIPEH